MALIPNSEQAERGVRRWRPLLLWLLAVSLLLAGVCAIRPAYVAFKGWRTRALAAQAERLMGEGRWPQAAEKAQAAWLLKPTEPAALRALARTLTHNTNVTALQLWQQLSASGHASVQDRRAFVELAIRLGSPRLALGELRQLLADSPHEPAHLWLASQCFAALGDRAQTLHYATRARLHDPGNRQYQLFLASLRYDSSETDKRAEARNDVWSLANEDSQLGLEALGFLARRPDLSLEQRREILSRLEQHPLAGITHRLMILEQRMLLAPEQREAILNQAVNHYRTISDPAALNSFAVWLNQREEYERTLVALPFETALQRRELFLPHADALASLGRWEELGRILDGRRVPLETVFVEAFQARCATKTGNAPAAAAHWRRALLSAERKPEQLHWLARYAEKAEELARARKAWRMLIGCVTDARPAYQALLELTAKSGEATELADLLDEMSRRWPDDPALAWGQARLQQLQSQSRTGDAQTSDANNRSPARLTTGSPGPDK
ncbi:MAG: hypothetical protein KIS67_10755 [Verrucomicrobiae bacterium]|nr:hypothetical protein [Verrucomicrobiae bacterium]